MERKEVLKETLIFLILLWILLSRSPAVKGGEFCYRPPVVYYPPLTYTPPVYYPPPTYIKEYVPYPLEVQVYKDRYFSLSDLYRDRLYVEAFDMLRDMRARMNQEAPQQEAKAAPQPTVQQPRSTTPPRTAPRISFGKASDKAKEILVTNCFSCHGKGNDKLDLSDPDLVPATARWASFGMMASRDMPKSPDGKQGKELEIWKAEHGLKDEEIKTLYDEWVTVSKKK